jgi:hypothetical protein
MRGSVVVAAVVRTIPKLQSASMSASAINDRGVKPFVNSGMITLSFGSFLTGALRASALSKLSYD